MLTATELDEDLAEMRSQVCANCVEKLPGGPPCAPRGKSAVWSNIYPR